MVSITICSAEKYELYINNKYVCNETIFGEIIKNSNVWWSYDGDNWTYLEVSFIKKWNNTGLIRIHRDDDIPIFEYEVLYKEWQIETEPIYIEAITEDGKTIVFKQIE
jgi:hypothetical protein